MRALLVAFLLLAAHAEIILFKDMMADESDNATASHQPPPTTAAPHVTHVPASLKTWEAGAPMELKSRTLPGRRLPPAKRRKKPAIDTAPLLSTEGKATRKRPDDIAVSPMFVASSSTPTESGRTKTCVYPDEVDAFCSVRNTSYLFSGAEVFSISEDRITSVQLISEVFPSAPQAVNAAVYDKNRRLLVLLGGRKVYAYKPLRGNEFTLHPEYPKTLPDNVDFTPMGAMRWHDRRQVLLSDDGRFAFYDEYWNKSLMIANTGDYFLNLPNDVRGVSKWQDGKAKIYTKYLVYTYDVVKNAIEEGVPLPSFLRCEA